MSGVKRTRTDEITSSSQPQTTTTTTATTTATISPKIETPSAFNSTVDEDYNW
jgi:hypothetical protein